MAITVQRTTGNQDHILFHHGLIKMMVQYQLDMVGRTWDEFLKDNGFGLSKLCPTLLPKTRSKWKRSLENEANEEPFLVDNHVGFNELCMVVEMERCDTSNPTEKPMKKK